MIENIAEHHSPYILILKDVYAPKKINFTFRAITGHWIF